MDLSARCCLTHTLIKKKKRKTAASPAAPRLPSQGTGAAVSTLADGWRRSYGPNTSRGSARLPPLPSRRLRSSGIHCCLTHTLIKKKKRKTVACPAVLRLPFYGAGAAVSTLDDGWWRSYGTSTSRGSAGLSRLPSRRLWSSRIRCCLTHTLIMIKKRKTVACPAVLRLPFHGAGTVVSTFATATAPSRCAYYPAQHLQQKKRSPIADACAQVVNTD